MKKKDPAPPSGDRKKSVRRFRSILPTSNSSKKPLNQTMDEVINGVSINADNSAMLEEVKT